MRTVEFELTTDRDIAVAAIVGEIDSSNATDLEAAVLERVPGSLKGLLLDLSGVSYVDSAGVQLLFAVAERLAARRQELRLVVPDSAPMRRVLELCAVDRVASIDESRDTALGILGSSVE